MYVYCNSTTVLSLSSIHFVTIICQTYTVSPVFYDQLNQLPADKQIGHENLKFKIDGQENR